MGHSSTLSNASGVKVLPSNTPRIATITARRRPGTCSETPNSAAKVVSTMAPIIQARGIFKAKNSAPPAVPMASALVRRSRKSARLIASPASLLSATVVGLPVA